MKITGDHPVLENYRDIVRSDITPGFWSYRDAMGELHMVVAPDKETARRLIDAAIDAKQVRILREELERMKEGMGWIR